MEKTKRPGRPTLADDGEPSTQVGVRLPAKDFDELCRRASQDRVTVAEVIRRDIRRAQGD
jgi:hypothetical protein